MLSSAKVKVSYDNIHLTLGMLHDYFSGVTRYSGPLDKYPSRAFPPLFLPSPLPLPSSPLLFLLLPLPFSQSSPPYYSQPFPPPPLPPLTLQRLRGLGSAIALPAGPGAGSPAAKDISVQFTSQNLANLLKFWTNQCWAVWVFTDFQVVTWTMIWAMSKVLPHKRCHKTVD